LKEGSDRQLDRLSPKKKFSSKISLEYLCAREEGLKTEPELDTVLSSTNLKFRVRECNKRNNLALVCA
jgi:hypothetical protein